MKTLEIPIDAFNIFAAKMQAEGAHFNVMTHVTPATTVVAVTVELQVAAKASRIAANSKREAEVAARENSETQNNG